MSSAGIISPVMSPMTIFTENQRLDAQLPELATAYTKQIRGRIKEASEEDLYVTVTDMNGMPVGGGKKLPLIHSPDEIRQQFGTVRNGMLVEVTYQGPDVSHASVRIIGDENTQGPEDKPLENNLKRNVYAIFSPGI